MGRLQYSAGISDESWWLSAHVLDMGRSQYVDLRPASRRYNFKDLMSMFADMESEVQQLVDKVLLARHFCHLSEHSQGQHDRQLHNLGVLSFLCLGRERVHTGYLHLASWDFRPSFCLSLSEPPTGWGLARGSARGSKQVREPGRVPKKAQSDAKLICTG